MQQLEMNLEVIIKEDLGQYVKRTMPTFLADVANSICHDIHRNLEDPETLFYLGNGYFFGTQCEVKSKRVPRKSRFRIHSQIKTLRLLGTLNYEIGMIVEQDYFRAMIAYLPAANRGHAGANFMLGLILFYGLSVNRNCTEALKFFRRSGNQEELFLEFLLKGLEEEGPIVYLTDDLNCSKNRSWVEKIREFLGSHTPAATSNKASSF